MRMIGIIMGAWVAFVFGATLSSTATAGESLGDCVRSCNEECNLLPGGVARKDCKTACFAGACAHPGALKVAAMTGEAGLDCEEDGICNEFCADGPVPDSPDCDTAPEVCPCDYSMIPKTADIWQCSGPTSSAPPEFTCDATRVELTGFDTYDPMADACAPPLGLIINASIPVLPGPCMTAACGVADVDRGVKFGICSLTPGEVEACAAEVSSYAQALDADPDVTVIFATDPAACPPLEP